jgi:hypothetical protein
LQIKTINWPTTDETDACTDDFIAAITEVIAGNMMAIENYLISPEDLLDQTPIN